MYFMPFTWNNQRPMPKLKMLPTQTPMKHEKKCHDGIENRQCGSGGQIPKKRWISNWKYNRLPFDFPCF